MSRKSRRSKLPLSHLRYFCESLECRTLLNGYSLVKDINTGTDSSSPIPMGTVGTTLFLTEQSGPYSGELFKTDGTVGGTSLVVDARPGPLGSIPPGDETGINFNGKFYYSSYDANGNYLTVSDGTAAGTSKVLQLNNAFTPLDGNIKYYAESFAVAGGKLYFTAKAASGYETVWVSDGTAAGTKTISQLTGNSALDSAYSMNTLGTKLLFTTNAGQIWQTDGTSAGTTLVSSGITVYSSSTTFDNNVFFYAIGAQTGLWKTNGTAAGTTLALQCQFATPQAPVVAGSKMYFITYDPANQNTEALFVYDSATHAATKVVTNLSAGPTFDPSWPVPLITAGMPNGVVLFDATSGSPGGLWSSDGTPANTSLIMPYVSVDTNVNAANRAYKWGVLGNTAYFSASTTSGAIRDLYSSDGTAAGTKFVAGPTAYSSLNPQNFINFQGKLYFTGTDLTHGTELWSTDGTTGGTNLAVDLDTAPGNSNPTNFCTVGNLVYFDATDTTYGTQPWVTDGTAAGTHMLAAIDSYGNARTSNFVTAAGKTFFTAVVNGGGPMLYMTDGTAAGTGAFSTNIATPNLTSGYISYNNLLYLAANYNLSGTELIKTDGTFSGTSLVADLNSGSGSSTPANFTVLNGKLIFTAVPNSNTRAQLMYSTDGTAAGTTQIGGYAFGNNPLVYRTVLNSKLYFAMYNPAGASAGMQLLVSDGNPGVTLVKQLTNWNATVLMVVNGSTIYFILTDPLGGNPTAVWQSDGTAAGTVQITTLPLTSTVSNLLATNGKVFFEGNYKATGYSGMQLWTTDGTAAGTTMLGHLTINAPAQISPIDGKVYVPSVDSTYGSALWYSDGTPAGTALDTAVANGGIYQAIALGNSLYLDGYSVGGNELMAIKYGTYDGSALIDTVTLIRDTDGTHIDWSDGFYGGQVLATSTFGLTINSGGGNTDVIVLNTSRGNPLPSVLHLNGTFTLNSLTGTNPLANTTLDLNTSTLFIKYASPATDPLTTIRGYLQNGYNSGLWTGTPTATTGVITSATAAGNAARATGIGYADSTDGVVSVPANTIELKYTLYGDTGLTGSVGFTDFMRMTQHFTQSTGATWGRGDFNYDGAVNSTDFNLLQPNYGQTLPVPATIPTIDPSSSTRPPRSAVLPPPASANVTSSGAATLVSDVPIDVSVLPKPKRSAARRHAHQKRH